MNFDQIVKEILDRTKISYDELMARIRQKQEEFRGLLIPEGAASIVAAELGVELPRKEPEVKPLFIEDLTPGMSGVDIVARVERVYEARSFERVDGSSAKVAGLMLADKTGEIRGVLWDDKSSLVERGAIKKGDAARISGGYVKRGLNEKPELHVGRRGSILTNPDDPRVLDLPAPKEVKVKIAHLKPGLGDVDVIGRVAAVGGCRSFQRPDGSTGKVATLVLFDGSGTTRASLWDQKAELTRDIRCGDVVKLENAYVRPGLGGKPELQVGWQGRVLLNPVEPGVSELPELVERPLKVREIGADMFGVELAARVRRVFELQEFRRDDGSTGKVVSASIADETGAIRASFWDEMAELARGLSRGDLVLLKGAYTKLGQTGKPEVHVGKGAHLEANPAGIEVGEPAPSFVRIGELEAGVDAIEVVGRVVEVSPPREFTRADGSKGRVATLVLGDRTGATRASLWHERAEEVQRLKAGDVVRLANCYTTLGLLGRPELQVGAQAILEVNPQVEEELPPAEVLAMAEEAVERVEIGGLQREGARVQVRGTITQVFHRRPLFDVCPSCGRSLGSVDTSLYCEECGRVVTPEHRVVVSFLLDDGTGNIRVVLFGEVAERLLGMDAQRVFELFKRVAGLEEFYRSFELAGREVVVTGTTRYDEYFGQLELRGSSVLEPDARQEARQLLEKVKV